MDHIKGQVPDEAWGNYYEPFSAFLRERGDLQLIQMEARDYGRRVQRRGWDAPANSSAWQTAHDVSRERAAAFYPASASSGAMKSIVDVKERSIKFKGLTQQESERLLPEGLILLGYRGSIAHGMYVPQENPNSIDDKDVMGVFVAPYTHYVGFAGKDCKEAILKEWDVVCYEVRKMISLLLKGNPRLWRLLWMPPTLPYWPLEGPFEGKERATKRLLFSAWNVVPDVVSAVLSYEAERLMMGGRLDSYEKPDEQQRPLLRLAQSTSGFRSRHRLLLLLLPCLPLADRVTRHNFRSHRTAFFSDSIRADKKAL